MYTVNYDQADTDNKPFRHLRGGSRKKPAGCLMFWGRLAWGQRLMLVFLAIGFCGVWSGLGYMFWPRTAAADEPPTPVVATAAPLPTAIPVEMMSFSASLTPTATTPLEPIQIAATATFQAAINRPAYLNNPAAAPSFVGVITYEDGCLLSNIGFTTSGYNGKPYYLYMRQQFDRNPLYQMAQISGFVQQFPDECQYPVIMVESVTWFDASATPAPLAISTTVPITEVWGLAGPAPRPTVYAPHPEYLTPAPVATTPPISSTATPWTQSGWSPQPWPTVNLSAIQAQIDDIKSDINAYKAATKTATPSPTATHTATPQSANVVGQVINVAGCANTNLAIQSGVGQQVLLMFSGAALPSSGQPTDYHAVASGLLGAVCGQTGLWASSISWYLPTLTPTATSTATPTETPTPTATATETPTIQPEPTATE